METKVSLEGLLHPRIAAHCTRLYIDSHFRHAAREAMTQVELALKEKSGVKDKYGTRLVNSLLERGIGIKLVVPFGPEMQKHAHALFESAFSYYRNYAVHDGSEINDQRCLRIMILASELLDLINASEVSFADIGGVKGLVSNGLFSNENQVCDFLSFLSGYTFPEDARDGFFEDLVERGVDGNQVKAVIETGLIEYKSEEVEIPEPMRGLFGDSTERLGSFQLTRLGEQVLDDLKKRLV
jgi:uncharacterized protein (TIGR02391 family)